MLVSKEILHERSVHSRHSCVMDSEAVGQEILQVEVLHLKHESSWFVRARSCTVLRVPTTVPARLHCEESRWTPIPPS